MGMHSRRYGLVRMGRSSPPEELIVGIRKVLLTGLCIF